MTAPRIIKKYPNRRLYDTGSSQYISLAQVKQLVVDYIDFRVLDSKTEQDLTTSVLLQVISEQECSGDPILSNEVLKHMIRYHGDAMQAMMSRFLSDAMQQFMAQQAQLKNPLNTLKGGAGSQLQKLTKQALVDWHQQELDKLKQDSD